jgi:hypothetical protein
MFRGMLSQTLKCNSTVAHGMLVDALSGRLQEPDHSGPFPRKMIHRRTCQTLVSWPSEACMSCGSGSGDQCFCLYRDLGFLLHLRVSICGGGMEVFIMDGVG